jgi:fatty-acyl-CoA synthase
MDGTMMKYPLTLTSLLQRAGKLFPEVQVVSRRPDKTVHRYTYRDFNARALALCAGLQRAGLKRGDRVATLMWNHAAHLECYFGIPAAGGVLHTLNLRLHPDELSYIANHAQDRFLIVDDVLLHLFNQIKDKVNFERVFVVQHICDALPEDFESYESLMEDPVGHVECADVDENEGAAMCYTSGTTGKPKGVVYSHRALALHSLSIALPDHFNIARRDVILPAMSMFHANAWGLPYAAVMTGCKLVFPGPDLHPESLLNAMQEEKVTLTGAVPTVWLAVLECLERNPGRWKLEHGMRILVAGSAAPEMLFRGFDKFGITVIQPWGMTETTPICTFSVLKPHMENWPEDQKYQVRAKQGLPSPFIDLRAVGEDGEISWDGESVGELQVRGAWVTASYFNLPEQPDSWTEDGWLRTGDVVNIDSEGYIKITDRAKDLIKSGGEWISSVDLENALVAHPGVAEAAVIAVAHPKWQERPLALIVAAPNVASPTVNELRDFLSQKFAKWQLPDDFVFVEELPHTSTGKLLKTAMRDRFKNWYSKPRSD